MPTRLFFMSVSQFPNSKTGHGPSIVGHTWNHEMWGALCFAYRAFWIFPLGLERQLSYCGCRVKRRSWREMSKGKFRCDLVGRWGFLKATQRGKNWTQMPRGFAGRQWMRMWEGHVGGDEPWIQYSDRNTHFVYILNTCSMWVKISLDMYPWLIFLLLLFIFPFWHQFPRVSCIRDINPL